ncbi:MAG: hypothetical protein DBX59_10530, partial [Bacillota bacterium]
MGATEKIDIGTFVNVLTVQAVENPENAFFARERKHNRNLNRKILHRVFFKARCFLSEEFIKCHKL